MEITYLPGTKNCKVNILYVIYIKSGKFFPGLAFSLYIKLIRTCSNGDIK